MRAPSTYLRHAAPSGEHLEIYNSGPIEGMSKRRAPVGRQFIKEIHMIGLIARWGHNFLLAGMALVTLAIVYSLK
jgi:hypothetical protein